MPLNKGLRDQENDRINNILKRVMGMGFLPGSTEFTEDLSKLGLSINSLSDFNADKIISHLQKLHLDWANMELFADFLVKISNDVAGESAGFRQKAVKLYEFIQSESKTFSFDIFNKIAAAK